MLLGIVCNLENCDNRGLERKHSGIRTKGGSNPSIPSGPHACQEREPGVTPNCYRVWPTPEKKTKTKNKTNTAFNSVRDYFLVILI